MEEIISWWSPSTTTKQFRPRPRPGLSFLLMSFSNIYYLSLASSIPVFLFYLFLSPCPYLSFSFLSPFFISLSFLYIPLFSSLSISLSLSLSPSPPSLLSLSFCIWFICKSFLSVTESNGGEKTKSEIVFSLLREIELDSPKIALVTWHLKKLVTQTFHSWQTFHFVCLANAFF